MPPKKRPLVSDEDEAVAAAVLQQLVYSNEEVSAAVPPLSSDALFLFATYRTSRDVLVLEPRANAVHTRDAASPKARETGRRIFSLPRSLARSRVDRERSVLAKKPGEGSSFLASGRSRASAGQELTRRPERRAEQGADVEEGLLSCCEGRGSRHPAATRLGKCANCVKYDIT